MDAQRAYDKRLDEMDAEHREFKEACRRHKRKLARKKRKKS